MLFSKMVQLFIVNEYLTYLMKFKCILHNSLVCMILDITDLTLKHKKVHNSPKTYKTVPGNWRSNFLDPTQC